MTKLNLGSGGHPLDGFVNLDKRTGWTFESGIPYRNNSVDAITISHALMYVKGYELPKVFRELWRVLKINGVVRITEDATNDPKSERFGGHYDAVSLTSAGEILDYLRIAHFRQVYLMTPEGTIWEDDSLIQNWHGRPPKVFHVEALK